MTFNIGENVGAYRIVEQLGQGGMATVFKAYHAALDRYVAIKVLHAAFKEDPTFLARFQREARVVAKLEHPNIVPVYDYAEHKGSPYLVMKFIEGETLKARLTRGPLGPAETCRIVEAVGAGLEYAHQQGILHRDIKPSNVMLAQDGTIYLADFGLARIAMAGESTLSADSMLGTPQYMSPEQAKGIKDLDAGTDIYSFGVMLYELTVGRVPYSADTPFAIIHDHIYTPLPMPRVVNPNVSEAAERVLLKALAKERGDRYPDVTSLVQAFLAVCAPIVAATPTMVVPAPEPTRAGPSGGATVLVSPATAAAPPGATVLVKPSAGTASAPPVAPAVAQPAQKTRGFPWLWVGLGGLALVILVGVLGLGLVVGANAQKRRATATALAAQARATATALALAAVAPTAAPLTPLPTEPPLPPGVLYLNNFDNGQIPVGWKLDPGWGVEGGALCGKGHQWANYLKGTWPDYREAFRLRLDQGQLHVNYRVGPEPLSRYFVVFDPKIVILSKQVGDKFDDNLRSTPYEFQPGQWYDVEVLGQGPHIMVTVNKEIVLDFTDAKPLLEGGMSFESLDNSTACVDDLEINQLTSPLPESGAPLPPGVLYLNNFDNGQIPDGWQLDPGWGVEGGALCGKGHQWANFLQGTWRDYREALRLRLDQGQVHVNYRVKTTPAGLARYFVVFDPQSVTLAKQVGDKVDNNLRTTPFEIKPGNWYDVEVMGQGPRILVTVNKVIVADFTDADPLLEGGMNFETLDNSTACIDYLEVDALTNPLPPPAESPVLPAAGGGDPMAMITAAGQIFDEKMVDKGWAVLDEAVALDPQNPKVLLAAGDTALAHGAAFAQKALNRYYLPAYKIARDQKDDLASLVGAHTALAMYVMALDPDGPKYFTNLAGAFQPPEWPLLAKARCDLFAPNADLGAVEKELADLMAKFPDNQVLYLIRGDLYVRLKRPVLAGKDYNAVMKNWSKDMPAWVLAEAQCKFKAVQENRLNANMELTCESLSSLVTGK